MSNKREFLQLVKEAAKPTRTDKVIAFFSPEWATSRQKYRVREVCLQGGYQGASTSRRALSEYAVSDYDADGDTLPDLPLLRERSRDLARNNPLALGAINTKVTNIVGTGLRLNPQIDADLLGLSDDQAVEWEKSALREWQLFAESTACDLENTLNFYDMQSLVLRSVMESGDIFPLLPYKKRRNDTHGLKIQLIEADRVCNEDFVPDSSKLAGGIEKDADGAPIAYHILNVHPGDYRNEKARKWQKVKTHNTHTNTRQALHLYRKLRPGQTRGVPELAPVIELIKQLGTYTDAEVSAAVISSFFTVFVKSESGAGLSPMQPTADVGGSTTDKDYKLGKGAILDLLPGEEIETADPSRPNQAFDPFIQAVLRQIGVALELPFEMLIKHFTASYSAARAAMLEAWKHFSTVRFWLSMQFCQPVYEAFIAECVATGRLKAPGFFRDPLIRKAYCNAVWIGPARGQIDPKKENEADGYAEDRGWSTVSENTAQRGGNWEHKVNQRVREKRIMDQSGLAPVITEENNNEEPPANENSDDTKEDKTEDDAEE